MFGKQFGCLIRGSIIQDNNPIVGVVLLEDRLDVPQVSVAVLVVVAGHYHTHSDLFCVLADIVFLLEALLLLLGYLSSLGVGVQIHSV